MCETLIPPCAYQGGKQRLSKPILDIIDSREGSEYKLYDLCCGSGAVSLEALGRGKEVMMIDKGCYGLFWESVTWGKFNLDIFRQEIDKLPEVDKIHDYLKDISNKPVDTELQVYHYLLLQAGAFGSKQIWVSDGKWCNNTFRSYWLPTETSNRRSPVNPMMPLPETLYTRVSKLVEELQYKHCALQLDVFEIVTAIKADVNPKVVYIDPPYEGTTGYKEKFDINELISHIGTGTPIYVSEGYKMPGAKESWLLSKGREKGNISGNKNKKPVEEWLNYFI